MKNLLSASARISHAAFLKARTRKVQMVLCLDTRPLLFSSNNEILNTLLVRRYLLWKPDKGIHNPLFQIGTSNDHHVALLF